LPVFADYDSESGYFFILIVNNSKSSSMQK